MAIRWVIFIAIATLLIGLVVGWVAGRAVLERQWGNPFAALTSDEAARVAVADADPTPQAGTRVLRPVPLLRARAALDAVTAEDRLKLAVGSVGRGDEGAELHLVLENRGPCVATAFAGVAYGYDAFGRASKMNKSGEHFVAFSEDKAKIDPGGKSLVSRKLRWPATASLAVAHVDRVTCADGTTWSRR